MSAENKSLVRFTIEEVFNRKKPELIGSVYAADCMSDRLIKKVTPRYPPEAKGFRLDGVVMLMVEINETGDVEKIDIVMPAGAGLDESAVEAVSQWKYKPTLLNGKPIRVVTTVTVNYQVFR